MEPEESGIRSSLVAVLGVGAVLVLLYSLFIAQQLLLGVFLVVFATLVYLFYRLVLAVERIARALGRPGD